MQREEEVVLRVIFQKSMKCHRCGNCCIDSDPINIYREDITDLSKFLKMPESEFIERHTAKFDGEDGYKLKNVSPCEFWDVDTKKCKVYPARPIACRAYPVLSSECIAKGTMGYIDCPGSADTLDEFNRDNLQYLRTHWLSKKKIIRVVKETFKGRIW